MPKMIILFIATALFTVGCSHSKKQAEHTAATAPATPAVTAPPQTAPEAAKENSLSCSKGKDNRILKLDESQPKGCQLHYTSYGKTKMIASSTNGPSHCMEVKSRIQKKLETAGYKCDSTSATAPVQPKTSAQPAQK